MAAEYIKWIKGNNPEVKPSKQQNHSAGGESSLLP